ncbi:M20/M25/M40 family metallo-hydrolase [Novosphingobium piscinae]|uniref:M20/M25/M40 family metallo-hydrolase n=1 Tax=Novosphingobium piscinae TaxID=1507448 RepID=A0A7X1FW49_9SPHN|nr:M20/M25/M40 family metallo-hydrolase [Novosphingobium piscinae]MBC2668061.1 M20/M25/M40 family metallo-hydrolase [Novosphingobium piscinae]
MKRVLPAMKRGLAATLVAASLAASGPLVAAAPKRDLALEAALLAHIKVLASDAFAGREPGTEGEAETLRYLGKQWFDIGLVSGTNDPGHAWFAPVNLVAREPAASAAVFARKGKRLYMPRDATIMLTSGKRALVENAPMLFVGTGAAIEQLARNELAGRVAVLLDGGVRDSERQNALLKAGAAAVLTVLDSDRTLEQVAARRRRSGYALATDSLGGDLEGFITAEAFDRLLVGSSAGLAALRTAAAVPGFVPRLLDLTATMEATTRETTIRTHNLIGKLEGRRPEAGAVLFMAHWDHFGRCADAPAEHLVCNGAIDNASGVAALTEVARRLSRGPQQERDIYFVATTAEELGLLGAAAFAENPPLPLKQIVAAFNIDSVAIAPAGTPLAIVGRGMTPLDPQILAAAKANRRVIVPGTAANDYVKRQDGWMLLQHDVPAVMVTSAYGNLALLERFFETDYHRPSDVVKPGLELGGAAEDVSFLVALGRWFADPRRVPLTR